MIKIIINNNKQINNSKFQAFLGSPKEQLLFRKMFIFLNQLKSIFIFFFNLYIFIFLAFQIFFSKNQFFKMLFVIRNLTIKYLQGSLGRLLMFIMIIWLNYSLVFPKFMLAILLLYRISYILRLKNIYPDAYLRSMLLLLKKNKKLIKIVCIY